MICSICKKEIKDEYMEYKDGNVKCKPCHILNPIGNFQECLIFSRVVGYIQPVQNFNPGKVEEYRDRKEFSVEKSLK